MAERGPLILGAGGRLGRAFRTIAEARLWPGPPPVWHARRPGAGLIGWDLTGPPPHDLTANGVVVLAGATAGDEAALDANRMVALSALDLADRQGLGPVLLLSSAAVYGRGAGPHAEDDRPEPATPYGAAKLAMERAVAGRAATCLRLANVAGSDAVFGAMARGGVVLDRFANGEAPRRAYVGPLTLARALVALLGAADALPPVLNLAQPGTVAMDALLRAAGLPWCDRPAPPDALPEMALDLSNLEAFLRLPPAEPADLMAEARLAGWRPAAGEVAAEASGARR